MRRTTRKNILVLAVASAVALGSAAALGKGPGGGGGGGGGPGEETLSNNLSVPTIMIGGGFTGVSCGAGEWSDLVWPNDLLPLAGYEIDPAAYYYVQGVHTWQAPCATDTYATATAEWGDNLAGDAKLQVGKPIRVELGLFDDTGIAMDGFNVVKLEPSKLDRESAYGTEATDDGLGNWSATAELMGARVFDAGVTFSVMHESGEYAVPLGSNPTAEINATGKVVYGYNLRVSEAGAYEITFVIPNVDITGVDAGTYESDPLGPDTVTLIINVIQGGGGGGGGKPR